MSHLKNGRDQRGDHSSWHDAVVKQQRAYLPVPEPQQLIHCRWAGDHGPFVILLHQIPLSCRQYERAIPVLGDFCRAYGLDLPGYGMSPAPPAPLSMQEYAKRMLSAIDSLGADRFALVGLETGVALGAEIFRQAGAKRVSHFVVMAPPPVDPVERRAFIDDIGEPRKVDGTHALPLWQRLQRRWGEDTDNATLRMAFTETNNVYARYHWGLKAFAAYDYPAALEGISCPTVFLSGERDSMLPFAPAAAALVPRAQHIVVPGGRPPLASIERNTFADVIGDFVGRA